MKKLADVSSIVENFELFGTQLNSFLEEIETHVRKRIPDETKFRFLEKSIRDTHGGHSTWIDVAKAFSVPIKDRSNGKPVYLIFVVELTSERIFGEQLRADLAKTPLLHVAISSIPAAFNNRVGEYWIAQIPPASDEYFELKNSAFWLWPSEGSATARAFDLKLDSVLVSYPVEVFARPAEVKRHLVDPLIKILNGNSLKDALENAPLLRYEPSDDKLSYSLRAQT